MTATMLPSRAMNHVSVSSSLPPPSASCLYKEKSRGQRANTDSIELPSGRTLHGDILISTISTYLWCCPRGTVGRTVKGALKGPRPAVVAAATLTW